MTLALVVKIVGGILVVGAQRSLVRSASDLSSGWWFSSRFVPGATILFALLNFREMWSRLAAMCVGGVLIVSAYCLAIFDRVSEVQQMAAEEEAAGRMYDADDTDDEEAANIVEGTLKPAGPAASQAPASKPKERAPVAATAEVPKSLKPRLDVLNKRFAQLQKERAALKPGDEEALRSFNIKAADYTVAAEAFRADLAAVASGGSQPRSARVKVTAGGVIFLNGEKVSAEALDASLIQFRASGVQIRYFRENPERDPTPVQDSVFKKILEQRLPVQLAKSEAELQR